MRHTLKTLLPGFALAVSPFIFCAEAQTPQATIHIDAAQVLHPVSRYLTGACIEDVNHEVYGGIYSQMIFGESFQERAKTNSAENWQQGVTGQWRGFASETARPEFSLDMKTPFIGNQSQIIKFADGVGAGIVGIENKGLNRWGMNFVQGLSCEGHLWVRSPKTQEFYVCLESADGKSVLAEKRLVAWGGGWERVNFVLTPSATDHQGRFAIKLKQPGELELGYAFLQPEARARFHGLPDRRDVAEALMNQGITVLRYGGSMVNSPNYRWKKMIGPRDTRPPYDGTWYHWSTDGWGIIDFLDLCEAAHFLPVPAFNMDETPQDMADFVEYVNGSADTPWGRKRAEAGHPAPYRLKHLELGNEERVDENYLNKFKGLAEAIWSKDPAIIPVVGDFAYGEKITDPMQIKGAASRIPTLAAQREILRYTKEHGGEVWFDVHVGTEGPRPDSSLAGAFSFADALEGLADGARFHVVIFEFNANNPSQRRALANALAMNAVERDGRFPIATSANCLQPDGQNDNGWNQGLLFLNPSQVWLQPPGYVTQMIARNYAPLAVKAEVQGGTRDLDVSAKCDGQKTVLTLQVVNTSAAPIETAIRIEGFTPRSNLAEVSELSAPLKSINTAAHPDEVKPVQKTWRYELNDGAIKYTFVPYSLTTLRLK
jgi:hypothetical protein